VQAGIGIDEDIQEGHGGESGGALSLFSPLLPLPAAHKGNKHCLIKGLSPESPVTCQERTKTRWFQPRQLLA
jgi:hypothetical protein